MRYAVSTRQSNNDATLDARDDQVAKTNQRAVARGQRMPGRILAFIQFNIGPTGTDNSRGVLCNENGISLGVTIPINGIKSVINCRPQMFGYALYEVTICGLRSSNPVWAAVRLSDIQPNASLGTAQQGVSFTSGFVVTNAAGTTISTTLGSNTLPVSLPNGSTDPTLYSFAGGFQYVATSTVATPVVVVPYIFPAVAYGIVAWGYHGTSDSSTAELCNIDGTRLGTAVVVGIDFLTSVRPLVFGSVAYKLEYIKFTTQAVYRAVLAIENIAAGIGYSATLANYAGTGGAYTGYACYMAISGGNITTVINSMAIANVVLVSIPQGTPSVGQLYDLPAHPAWCSLGSGYPMMVQAIYAGYRPGLAQQPALGIILMPGETAGFVFSGILTLTSGGAYGNGGWILFTGSFVLASPGSGISGAVAGDGSFFGFWQNGSGATLSIHTVQGSIGISATVSGSAGTVDISGSDNLSTYCRLNITTTFSTMILNSLTMGADNFSANVSLGAITCQSVSGGRGTYFGNGGA